MGSYQDMQVQGQRLLQGHLTEVNYDFDGCAHRFFTQNFNTNQQKVAEIVIISYHLKYHKLIFTFFSSIQKARLVPTGLALGVLVGFVQLAESLNVNKQKLSRSVVVKDFWLNSFSYTFKIWPQIYKKCLSNHKNFIVHNLVDKFSYFRRHLVFKRLYFLVRLSDAYLFRTDFDSASVFHLDFSVWLVSRLVFTSKFKDSRKEISTRALVICFAFGGFLSDFLKFTYGLFSRKTFFRQVEQASAV